MYYAFLQSMQFAFLRMHAWHSSLVAQAARAAEPWQGFVYTNTSRQTLCQWHSSGHIYGQYVCHCSFFPTDHPCDSVLGLFVCAGVDFRRSQGRAAELWQGFVPHSLPAVFPPLSIWANACLIVSTPSLVPPTTSACCCVPNKKTGNV